jgi:hypothetical protein
MNRLDELFVVERLNKKGDCADLRRSEPRGAIVVSCDHNHISLRRYRAKARQNFQAGHFLHPKVEHDEAHIVRGYIVNEIRAFVKRLHVEPTRAE